MLAQTRADGQSPQEQPSEVSPHEYADTFIGCIPADSGAVDLNVMAYGEPGRFGAARLPINAYHSAKNSHGISTNSYPGMQTITHYTQATDNWQ